MPAEPIDPQPLIVVDDQAAGETRSHGRRRERRTWIEGGSTVARWRADLLGWTIVSLAIGILASVTLNEVLPVAIWGWAAAVVLWLALFVPVVFAFRRSVPRPLLRFRATDLLYGLVLGVMLRVIQGWIALAAGGSDAWPSYTTIAGQLPAGWWFIDLVSVVVISPVLEEFFFRGVLLVVVYSVVRRAVGLGTAGFAAVITSTGLFVLGHVLTSGIAVESALSLGMVGLTCSLLVLLTGRIWGALLVHATFNASYVVLALIGTLVGVGGV